MKNLVDHSGINPCAYSCVTLFPLLYCTVDIGIYEVVVRGLSDKSLLAT
jgi:hypothetical protein